MLHKEIDPLPFFKDRIDIFIGTLDALHDKDSQNDGHREKREDKISRTRCFTDPLNRFSRTGLHAVAAADASVLEEGDLWIAELGFRIAAPRTAQGASFHKNQSSYPWSVMDAEALNIGNHTLHFLYKSLERHQIHSP